MGRFKIIEGVYLWGGSKWNEKGRLGWKYKANNRRGILGAVQDGKKRGRFGIMNCTRPYSKKGISWGRFKLE